MVTEDLIARAGRLLAEAARPPARIILFGSHARGEAGARSDLDFLVIEREVADRHAEMARLRRVLRGFGVPIDVIVVSERFVEEWGEVQGTLVNAALNEGRILDGEA